MKKIILREITLTDWKGQNRRVCFHDGVNTISGKNGSGKTSIYKAFCWLLTSYTDAENVKNHELFDNRFELSNDTPAASVCATLEIDGSIVKLERIAKCAFTRNRSTNEYVKAASDAYTLRIDDIEASASTFNKFIDDTFGSLELLQYMLMGNKFANLTIDDKNKARKVLESIVGEIKDEDFTKDYSDIDAEISKYGVDPLKERYKNQLRPLTSRINEIDTLVKFNSNRIKSIDCNFDELKSQIDEVNGQICAIDEKILGESSRIEPLIKQRDETIARIHQKTIELGQLRAEYIGRQKSEISDIEAQIRSIDAENANIEKINESAAMAYDYVCKQYEQLNREMFVLKNKRESLVEKRNEVKSRTFSDDTCKYCGQTLPQDKLDELKRKFNVAKDEELYSIIEEGKQVRAQIDSLSNRLDELQKKKEEGFDVIPFKNIDGLTNALYEIKSKQIPLEDTQEYISISREIDELKNSIVEIKTDTSDLVNRKNELQDLLATLNRKYGAKDVIDEIEKTISKLKEEKRQIAIDVAIIEGKIDLLKEYVEERANIVSNRINEKLDTIQIQMFSRQKDGELKPDCVIVGNDGVKYSTSNNSSRIKYCIEIQRMFASHFDICIPVFIDEYAVFDSSNAPVVDGCQQINLCASDGEFKLD